jgi:hypothetical protein
VGNAVLTGRLRLTDSAERWNRRKGKEQKTKNHKEEGRTPRFARRRKRFQ